MLEEAPELALYAAPGTTYDPGSDGRVGMLEEALELTLYPALGTHL